MPRPISGDRPIQEPHKPREPKPQAAKTDPTTQKYIDQLQAMLTNISNGIYPSFDDVNNLAYALHSSGNPTLERAGVALAAVEN
ncbi:MAG TPA: hypothetical protein VIH61_09055, partial [Waddliaceae bacterium]